MGAYRDGQMFDAMDAEAYGYKSGRNEAESLIYLQLAETMGVGHETIKNLTSRDVSSKLVGMRAVYSALQERIEEESKRETLLVSPDPNEVAGVIIAEQTDFFGENSRGYVSGNDYDFVVTVEGVGVRTPVFLTGPLHDPEPIDAHWVSEHLGSLGFDRDTHSSGEVAMAISEQIQGKINNG